MAKIKFSRKEFEKHIKLTKEIEEKISMFGTHLESLNKDEIEIEILPNRPDLFSLQGFIRAFSSFIGKSRLKKYKINKPQKDYKIKIESSVKDIRPFTVCAIVKNLKFNDEKIKEIIDIQEKLHTTIGRNRKKIAIGIYPLEKIKLPISYRAESPQEIKFIPLESKEEMTGRQILQKHPAGREYSFLLEDKKKFPVFRDSSGQVLSMPPIINSQLTGKIDEKTKEIFIECSGFDIEILKKVLNILVTTFADMGGEIFSMNLEYENKKMITPDLTPEKLKIDIEECEKLLGINLKEQEVKKFLEKMGYSYNSKNNEVEIPAYRTDILHPCDIYEDIAIAYGYQNFQPEIPEISTIGQENPEEIKKRKISEILIGLGFLEILTYHLTTKQDMKKFMQRKKTAEVENSKTDFSILRPSLLAQTLRVFSNNIDSRYPQKIFELGRIFEKQDKKIQEKEKLSIAISGETDFTEMKQVLEYLMKMLNLDNYRIEEAESGHFISGRTAKIIIHKENQDIEIGIFGEISPSILKNFHLKMPVVALEIDVEEI